MLEKFMKDLKELLEQLLKKTTVKILIGNSWRNVWRNAWWLKGPYPIASVVNARAGRGIKSLRKFWMNALRNFLKFSFFYYKNPREQSVESSGVSWVTLVFFFKFLQKKNIYSETLDFPKGLEHAEKKIKRNSLGNARKYILINF